MYDLDHMKLYQFSAALFQNFPFDSREYREMLSAREGSLRTRAKCFCFTVVFCMQIESKQDMSSCRWKHERGHNRDLATCVVCGFIWFTSNHSLRRLRCVERQIQGQTWVEVISIFNQHRWRGSLCSPLLPVQRSAPHASAQDSFGQEPRTERCGHTGLCGGREQMALGSFVTCLCPLSETIFVGSSGASFVSGLKPLSRTHPECFGVRLIHSLGFSASILQFCSILSIFFVLSGHSERLLICFFSFCFHFPPFQPTSVLQNFNYSCPSKLPHKIFYIWHYWFFAASVMTDVQII